MKKTPKASQNKAKDVVTIKTKRIDIPIGAKNEIARLEAKLQNYIAGIVAGLDIKGKWSFDMKSFHIIVEDKQN